MNVANGKWSYRIRKKGKKRMRRKRSDEKINKVSYQKRIPSFVKNRNN